MRDIAARRWWREPLLHFAVLGGLLLLAQHLWGDALRAWWFPERIEITAADRERVATAWRRETGVTPGAREIDLLLQGWLEDELLFREAKRLGLHQNDPVIQQRLLTNMRFVEQQWSAEGEGAAETARALVATAERLGMVDRDLVIRGRLIQRMRYRIESQVHVTPADVTQYLRDHAEALHGGERVRFQQRYFSADHAAAELALRRQQLQQGNAEVAGEPFLLGESFDLQESAVSHRFGSQVAEVIRSAPIGQWVGPVRSVYGQHLLRVEAREAGPPAYAEQRVTMMLQAEREREAVRAYIARERQRYRIVVEAPST